ncbi:glycosyltransferase family 4 protein [Halanaeroarchaeum sulfurireducens]|uniref:Group 1 glycosyl transferase n=1 Tax=Halanaeroarchaeum sulfurireducens TaxID=1604004 RepID=A0A0F7PDM6_9EURY|nr:glycosyltransferase family 4 protein [Halanaeroarchaeum sulfurireducens]AKH97438.1 group 1 glycosyl transferase [Halanaeroarchaeum sulfurireducens]ALG81834.1 group 1 glycosyl transferase [Halanaeroarchaeum sulfurireducens]
MDTIRPVLLTASDTGGAGTATRRIHNGLREIDVDSRMLVRDKSADDPSIYGPDTRFSKAIAKIRPHLNSLPLAFYDSSNAFSISWLPDRLHKQVESLNPDIIHLNWVANGYMSPKLIRRLDQPIVWRLPDMWPLTGGCHYADGCTRYRSKCGNCPQLDSDLSWDPSRITLTRKKRAVEQSDMTVVATTSWLAEKASESAVFENTPIKVIPNGLNTNTFKPFDQEIGRDLFDLPSDALLILFGAVSPFSNPRKGHDLLIEALAQLAPDAEKDVELVFFGASEPIDPPELEFPTHYTGYLNDEESLALLYSAVDIMVVPSRYEGFGQTVTEAMASGTPVVAFNTTGPGEIIDHKKTGYLASKFNPSELADGIEFLLTNPNYRAEFGDRARAVAVNKYDYKHIAEKYRGLYESLI